MRRGARERVGRVLLAALATAVVVSGLGGCSRHEQRSSRAAASSVQLPTASASTPPPMSRPPPTACDPARAVASWPLTRRAAQLLVVPVADFDVAGAAGPVRAGTGGILFLGTAPAPTDLGKRLSSLVAQAPAGVAPFVMADEEGGGVQRLSGVVQPIPWARQMAASMPPDAVRALAAGAGRQMNAAGVTVDLAPVLDADARPGPNLVNPDGLRSFSGDPELAALYGLAFATGLRDAGVLAVAKHFPGLGGVDANTDVRPAATLPITTLRSGGLTAFQAAVRAGIPAVMVANAWVPGLTRLPASLSSAVVTDLLRRELGFTGLVMTDSLSTTAISSVPAPLSSAAVMAIGAGVDMVLFGSTLTPADRAQLAPGEVERTFGEIVDGIVQAVWSKTLPEARLNAAVTAALAAKGVDPCAGGGGGAGAGGSGAP